MKKIVDVVIVSFLLIILVGFTLLIPFALYLLAFGGLNFLPFIDITIVNPLDFVGNGVILGISSIVYLFCLDISYEFTLQPYMPETGFIKHVVKNIVGLFSMIAFAFIYCYFAPSIQATDFGALIVGVYFFVLFTSCNIIFDLFIEKRIHP